MARTPEIGQGRGRIVSCRARKPEQTRWTYNYCGLRTTLFHDLLILPWSCQQVKEDNIPPHWGLNPRTSVCEANALPLTTQTI